MRLRGESHFLKEVKRGTILELLSAEHPRAVNSFQVPVTHCSKLAISKGLGSERRRMMNVCTLQCRAYIEAGMSRRAAWGAHFLFFYELPFGPREGRFSICSERSTSSAPCHLCGRANGVPILKNVFDNANFAVVWRYRAGESSIICAPNCSPSRNS